MRWIHREPLGLVERGAHLSLIAAFALTIVTAYRAWTVTTVPEASTAPLAQAIPQLGERVAFRLADAVRAVERDPFHPERRGPVERYIFPETSQEVTVSRGPSGRDGPVRLLGTAVQGPAGGFAMCQMGREAPRMLRVGDTLGGLTLRTISRAAAQFTDAQGATVTLRLPGTATEGAM